MTLPGMVVARYLVPSRENDLPPARSVGYDYVLAGNGLFKRARNRHCEIMHLLASARVAGLPERAAYLRLRFDPLPERFLSAALRDARDRSRARPEEAMYHVWIGEDGRPRLTRPRQTPAGAGIRYEGGGDPGIALDLHSHHQMPTFFSRTDDRDELGFRFYAVMGRIWTHPQIALRLGVYGDFAPLPITAIFEGPGPFTDVGLQAAGRRLDK